MYWQDFLIKTMGLTAEEKGVYLMLIALAWIDGQGCVPSDMQELKAKLQFIFSEFHGHTFNRVVPKLLKRYFYVGEDGNYYQKRVVEELEKMIRFSEKQAKIANKRWSEKQGHAEQLLGNRSANDEQSDDKSQTNASHREQHQGLTDASAMLSHSHTQQHSHSPIAAAADGGRPVEEKLNGKLIEGYDLAKEVAAVARRSEDFEISGWGGAAYRAQQWLDQGWPKALILSAVRERMHRRRYSEPPSSIQYFEKAIAEHIARQNAPLPTIVEIPAQTIKVTHAKPIVPRQPWQKQRDDWFEAVDEFSANVAALKQANDEGVGSGGEIIQADNPADERPKGLHGDGREGVL